jgi:hypothetical protein
LQHALKTSNVIHLRIKREAAGLLDTRFAVPAHQAECPVTSSNSKSRRWLSRDLGELPISRPHLAVPPMRP